VGVAGVVDLGVAGVAAVEGRDEGKEVVERVILV
jgi:hypothetical protein